MMKNKKYQRKNVFTFILFCTITSLLMPAALASAAEIDYLGEFNRLSDNRFEADYFLTREDFCVSVSKIFLKDHSENTELPFEDTHQMTAEGAYYLSALYHQGILSGVSENGHLYMRPELGITRQEALTLLGRILSQTSEGRMSFSDEGLVQPYAYGYIAWFAENGIIIGYPDGSLGPEKFMTANELAILTVKTMAYQTASDDQESGILMETVSGTGGRGQTDGNVLVASFTLPHDIICGDDGKITVLDTYNNAIRIIHQDTVKTLTGGTSFLDDNGFSKGLYLDGAFGEALLNRPAGGAYNSKGEFFFADAANSVIRYIKEDAVYTFSGTEAGFSDGVRDLARFNNPMAIAIDKYDNLYIADTLNNCIRKIDVDGTAVTIAGVSTEEGYRDGLAKEALFRAPAGITVSNDGSIIYVSDTGNHIIRKIENGQVTTIAGTISKMDDGYPLGDFANGARNEAMFNLPRGIIAVDGVLFIADSGNNMIRAVTKSKGVVTVAGNGDPGDFQGSCSEAVLNSPSGLSYYDGQLYIADTGNNKIKRLALDLGLYE